MLRTCTALWTVAVVGSAAALLVTGCARDQSSREVGNSGDSGSGPVAEDTGGGSSDVLPAQDSGLVPGDAGMTPDLWPTDTDGVADTASLPADGGGAPADTEGQGDAGHPAGDTAPPFADTGEGADTEAPADTGGAADSAAPPAGDSGTPPADTGAGGEPECRVPADCFGHRWNMRCRGHWSCVRGTCEETCDFEGCGDGVCNGRGGEEPESCPDCPGECGAPADCRGREWGVRCIGHFGCEAGMCTKICDFQGCGDGTCNVEGGEDEGSCGPDCRR